MPVHIVIPQLYLKAICLELVGVHLSGIVILSIPVHELQRTTNETAK